MLRDTLKVLLVEDRSEDAELLIREMRSRSLKVISRRVETGGDFEEALEAFGPDLILSDYTLPGFHGAVLARYPKQTNPLESGLLLHPEAIEGKVAALELAYGRGRIVLFGFKPQFRGQSHATYKYLFNELYAFDHPALPTEPVPSAKPQSEAALATPAKRAPGGNQANPDDDDIEE